MRESYSHGNRRILEGAPEPLYVRRLRDERDEARRQLGNALASAGLAGALACLLAVLLAMRLAS